ncbi:MAG: symporter small accessory protein [Methanothrix sp.]
MGLVLSMLGIEDPWIWGVYILCILSTLLCVIYGIVNWNRGSELEAQEILEEAAWESKEEEMEEKELGL